MYGGGKVRPPASGFHKAFREFLDDYVKTVRDQYAKADDLPKPNGVERFGTDAWLKISNTPPEWGDRLLQANLYAWDADKGGWRSDPIATADRVVWGKGKLWQHNLALLARPETAEAKAWRRKQTGVAEGKYLSESLRGRQRPTGRRLEGSSLPERLRGANGWVERLAEGYGKMTRVDAAKVRKCVGEFRWLISPRHSHC